MDNEENYNEIYQKGRKWLINIENYDKFIHYYLWNHYEDYYQIWNYFHEKVKIIRLPNWHLRSAKFLIIFVHWDLISKPFLGLRPALPLLELARTPSSPRDNLELIRPTSVAPILTTTVRWIDDTSNALIEMWAPFTLHYFSVCWIWSFSNRLNNANKHLGFYYVGKVIQHINTPDCLRCFLEVNIMR